MKKLLTRLRALVGWDRLADYLNRRTPREKLLFLGFGGMLILSLDYFLWLGPVVKHLTHTVPAVSMEETELNNLREDKKKAEEIRSLYDRLSKELAEREKAIEATNQVPALLENLSKLAGKSGVRITSLDPKDGQAPASGMLYSALPIDIKAMAGTHELGNFIASLETGDTAFKVLDLQIKQNNTNPKKHLVEMRVETYRRVSSQ